MYNMNNQDNGNELVSNDNKLIINGKKSLTRQKSYSNCISVKTDQVKAVDIVCGLAWGDEAKGKIVSELLAKHKYDWVCRWSGGSNAGHTIYIDGKKYVTHIIPAGVFYGIPSYIGPDCYVNLDDLDEEMTYLKNNGFNVDLIKVSNDAMTITNHHKEEDLKKYKKQQGSTGKGIAPCAKDKFARSGIRVADYVIQNGFKTKTFNPFKHLWSSEDLNNKPKDSLYGNILCEGAQGFWLDINQGYYPFVTSSITLPYSACSLGFPPQKIRHIYGAAKIYDTRVGTDPSFPDEMDSDPVLAKIGEVGQEFGATTGRSRKVWWLNIDKLIDAINVSGCTHLVISKTDVLDIVKQFKLFYQNDVKEFNSLKEMKNKIIECLESKCYLLKKIIFSNSPESVDGL